MGAENSFERVNNAIYFLTQRALQLGPNVLGAGSIRAIQDLANHWQQHVWSQPWRTMLPVAQGKTLEAYIRWYTRGYALLPASGRTGLAAPESLDPTLAADELRRFQETLQVAAETGADAGKELIRSADAVRQYAEDAAKAGLKETSSVLKYVAVGALGILGLALLLSKGARA
jgi:hypothetical protein